MLICEADKKKHRNFELDLRNGGSLCLRALGSKKYLNFDRYKKWWLFLSLCVAEA